MRRRDGEGCDEECAITSLVGSGDEFTETASDFTTKFPQPPGSQVFPSPSRRRGVRRGAADE
jgi:hypothetical protein